MQLRIIAPAELAERALERLQAAPGVFNVVHLPGVARKPSGDLIYADVTRADTSVVMGELRELGVPAVGTIALDEVDTELSAVADRAAAASEHSPFGDEVVWEAVEENTSEETELSINFVEFFLIAGLIAAVGILSDSPILIVAAMVVSPEFGPIAAACVAAVERRRDLARRSLLALAVGFPLAIAISGIATATFRYAGLAPDRVDVGHPLTAFIADPNFFSFFIAYLAGTAGMLSLTSAKSGALIGVLVSVTTIPAAANIGVAAAYLNWADVRGATAQLAVNLIGIFLGGIARLSVQHRIFVARRARYERRRAAGAGGGVKGAGQLP